MAISMNQIPSNLRVPLFYAEMDNSAANQASVNQRTLILGHKLASGLAATGEAVLITRPAEGTNQFGIGSMLADMIATTLKIDPTAELWAIAVAEPAGAAATGTIAVAGNATAAGVINLYVAGARVPVAVVNGDAPSVTAAGIAAAINANTGLPVTAAAVASTVTLTTKWKGLTGNDVTVLENYRGAAGGESTPPGVTLSITAMAGGVGAPDLSAAIVAMGDEEYDFVVTPFADPISLDALKIEMSDDAGRWAWNRQIYGHVYSARRDSMSGLVGFGSARNDQHATVAGFEADVPDPAWRYAAAYAARNAVFLKVDPARPTQTGALTGILPARQGKRFLLSERQILLNNGVATSYASGGVVRVERAVTTYQQNAYGQPDDSYLDSETLFTSAHVLRTMRTRITSKYGRHKLADDGTRFGPGQAIVTPSVIKGELLALYAELEEQGIVENFELFKQYLIVERNATNPNRVDVLFPPDYVNQLRVFAVLNKFRLQY